MVAETSKDGRLEREVLLKYLYLSVQVDVQLRLSISKLRIQCDIQLQLKFYMEVKVLKEMFLIMEI